MNYFVKPAGKRDWGYTIIDDAGKVRDAITGFTSGESAIRAAKGAIQRMTTPTGARRLVIEPEDARKLADVLRKASEYVPEAAAWADRFSVPVRKRVKF